MTRMTMFSAALALTLLGLGGCETVYGPIPPSNDRLNVALGSAPTTKHYGGYPVRGGDILLKIQMRF